MQRWAKESWPLRWAIGALAFWLIFAFTGDPVVGSAAGIWTLIAAQWRIE